MSLLQTHPRMSQILGLSNVWTVIQDFNAGFRYGDANAFIDLSPVDLDPRFVVDNNDYFIFDRSANTFSFVIGGTTYFTWSATASQIKGHVHFDADSTYDIGEPDTRIRAAYVGDCHLRPSASLTPTSNGDLVIEATNNTTLTFKYKGSDGTVRSGAVTLS